MKKNIILLLCFLQMPFPAYCQTVIWQMAPSDYNEVTRINNNLYRVTRNGKIGLINADGTIVAPAEYDKISDYYEHKALITRTDSRGERVAGCLTDEGMFYKFTQSYYTLDGQKFYSDGLLSVSDENGRLGYIDYQGRPIVGFDGRYDRVKPFVEGYAAMYKNKKYSLVDKEGTPVRFTFNSIASVYGGTNVYNGTVYVWDTNGKFYTYNITKGGTCKSVKVPSDKSFDFLYRFSAITGRSKTVPFVTGSQMGVKGITPSAQDGAYGYVDNGNIILPYQLSSASQFEDGMAVVSLNGRLGILRYIDGGSFGITIPQDKFTFEGNKSVECRFNLAIPSVWRNKDIKVVLKDENGTRVDLQNATDNYAFKVQPQKTSKKDYRVAIYAEELKLFESTLSYSFTKKEVPPPATTTTGTSKSTTPEALCPTCGKKVSVCEYKGKHPAEKKCPTCGKKIRECKYQGVH